MASDFARMVNGGRQRRPLRVLPLALGAVIVTVSAAGCTSEAFRELSGGRYAEEVIGDAL